MNKIKCPKCGIPYNETYDECPFCLEREEEELHQRRGKQSKQSKQTSTRSKTRKPAKGGFRFDLKMGPDILTPVLGVILVLLVLLLAYFLFGNSSSSSKGDDSEKEDVTQEEVETPSTSESIMPEVEAEPAPTTSVTLNRDDFTLSSGESWALEASGGSGVYTWSIENSLVATVQAGGVVTAVGGGNTVLTVTDGYTTAECIVRVKGAAATGSSTTSTSTSTSSTGSATLSHSDVTISVAESFTLKPSTGTATFAVTDASIATVSDSGVVTGVSSGTATITATVGDQTLTCLVRVR